MNSGAAVELFREFVAFDTTSSKSNVPLAERIADRLSATSAEVRLVRSPDGTKANVWARLGPEPDADRSGLVLSGHLDVVPADPVGWSSDPFALTDRADRWIARGACDMKGFVALATQLALDIDASHLREPLALLFTYDEEVGMHGAREFVRQWSSARPIPKSVVIGEPTGLEVVRLHKGHWKLRVAIPGRSAHSSTPQHGDNAIERAARVVEALARLRGELEKERPPLGEFFPEAPFVPLNVATIHGGSAVNVVPDRCVIEVAFRPLPGMDVEALERRVASAIHAAEPRAAIERSGFSEPLATPESVEIHRRLTALTGQQQSRGAPFSTDGGPLQTLGLEPVLWGPGRIEHAHRIDEWLEKDQFERCAAGLDSLVADICTSA